VHPKASLLQEDKGIRKAGRWVTEEHQNLFGLQRPTWYSLRSLKTSVTLENLNVQDQKKKKKIILGHWLLETCHAGHFLQRLN